jgi:hypothetical protein
MTEKRRAPGARPSPPPPRSRLVRGVRALGIATFTAAAFILGAAVGAVLADDTVHAAAVGALGAFSAFLYATALMSRPGLANRS